MVTASPNLSLIYNPQAPDAADSFQKGMQIGQQATQIQQQAIQNQLAAKRNKAASSLEQLYSNPEFQKLTPDKQIDATLPYVAQIDPDTALQLTQKKQAYQQQKQMEETSNLLKYNITPYHDSLAQQVKNGTLTSAEANKKMATYKEEQLALHPYAKDTLGNIFIDILPEATAVTIPLTDEELKRNNLPKGTVRTQKFVEGKPVGQPVTEFDATYAKQLFDEEQKKQELELKKQELQVKKQVANNKAISGSGASILDPQTLDFLSEQYIINKDLPNLGRGQSGDKLKIEVIKAAAKKAIDRGLTAQSLLLNKQLSKAYQTALSQVEKQKAQIGAFERTANKNLGIALNLSNKVDRSGVPVVDKWIMSGRKATGDKDVAAFDAAIRTAINEVAKVTSGGGNVISDSARKEIEGILNKSMSKAQIQSSIKILQQDMGNRMVGFDEEIKDIKNNISNLGGKSKSNNTEKQTSSIPTPKTQAEFNALPHGSKFYDDKGNLRVKK